MRSGKRIGQYIFRLLKCSLVISLLLLYFLGSSRIEFHNFFHANESVHSAQDEHDPCHIKVFHKQRDGGCDHTSHFVKEIKCALCDLQSSSNSIAEVRTIELPHTFCVVSLSDSIKQALKGAAYQFAGRAPPVC